MFQFLNTYHTCQEKNIQPKDLSNELAHAKPLLMSLKSTINVIKSYKKRQLALTGTKTIDKLTKTQNNFYITDLWTLHYISYIFHLLALKFFINISAISAFQKDFSIRIIKSFDKQSKHSFSTQ